MIVVFEALCHENAVETSVRVHCTDLIPFG